MSLPQEFAAFGAAWESLPLRRVAIGTVVVMLVMLLVALIVAIRSVLVAVFLAILLATALRPVMDGLRRVRMPRAAAAFVAVLILVLVCAGLLALTVPTMAAQGQALIREVPDAYARTRTGLLASPYRIIRQFAASTRPELPFDPSTYLTTLGAGVFALLPTIGYGLFVTITTLLLTYYWLFQRDRTLRGILLLLPSPRRADAETIWLQIEDKLGAFIRGQAVLAAAIAGLSLAGYWFVGLPYVLLMAVVAGILELVPVVGPIIAGLLAALIGFSVSVELGLAAVAVAVVVQQLENVLLVPRIMDDAVGVRPVVTLLALVGFTALFGLGGALLAIPLAAVLQVIFDFWLRQNASATTDGAAQGRSALDRLRYETQDLVQDVRLRLRNRGDAIDTAPDQAEEEIERVMAQLDALLQKN